MNDPRAIATIISKQGRCKLKEPLLRSLAKSIERLLKFGNKMEMMRSKTWRRFHVNFFL